MLDKLILLASLEDNIYVQKKLESIKELLDNESDNTVLGSKLRQLLK